MGLDPLGLEDVDDALLLLFFFPKELGIFF